LKNDTTSRVASDFRINTTESTYFSQRSHQIASTVILLFFVVVDSLSFYYVTHSAGEADENT